jgi:hypothetical protein
MNNYPAADKALQHRSCYWLVAWFTLCWQVVQVGHDNPAAACVNAYREGVVSKLYGPWEKVQRTMQALQQPASNANQCIDTALTSVTGGQGSSSSCCSVTAVRPAH